MENQKARDNYLIQTVQKAIQVVRVFSVENSNLTLTEIRDLTGIGISSLQRILYTLVEEGLLVRNENDKRYELGIDFIFLAELVKMNSSLISVAEPVVKKIQEMTTETVDINIVEGFYRKCILSYQSKHGLTSSTHVGHLSPLYAGASAKVLLAYCSDEKINDYLTKIKFEKIQLNTVTTRDKLLNDIADIRKKGYTVTYEERVKGAMAISAPIFDPFEKCIAALTVSLPLVRKSDYDIDELIQIVIKGAEEITSEMRN